MALVKNEKSNRIEINYPIQIQGNNGGVQTIGIFKGVVGENMDNITIQTIFYDKDKIIENKEEIKEYFESFINNVYKVGNENGHFYMSREENIQYKEQGYNSSDD